MTDWLAPYPDPMRIEHLALALGLCTRTLERRLARGLSMPTELRRIGMHRRWLKADVRAWATRAPDETAHRAHLRSHLRRAI